MRFQFDPDAVPSPADPDGDDGRWSSTDSPTGAAPALHGGLSAAHRLAAETSGGEEEFDDEDFDDDFDDDFEEELDDELNEDLDEFDEDMERGGEEQIDPDAADADEAFEDDEF